MKPFADQVAVVTGASGGIGHAIALMLAAQGAVVHALGRSAEALAKVEHAAKRAGGRVLTHRFDLRSDEDLARFAVEMDRVDILVHSAGVIKLGSFCDSPASDLDWHYQVNLRAPFLLTQLLLPMLLESQGQVVFINTSAKRVNGSRKSHYAATKHGLLALADSLRDEVNASGVRVLTVFAGRVASAMQQKVHATEGREYQPERLIQPEDIADVVVNTLALPRTAEITNVSVRPMLK